MDVWQVLMTPFSWLLKQFCVLFNSYGLALILFTVVIKLVLSPFQLKSKKSMIQMNLLSAQQREIQQKYANNPQKQNEEMQKLYAENGVNPMGGCLWSLLPMFILFPLYAIIRRPMKYMMWLTEPAVARVANDVLGMENFNPAMGTSELILASKLNAGNLAAAKAAAGSDSLFLINFNFFGLDLSQIPNWKFWEGGVTPSSVGLFLMVILSAVMAVVSMMVMTRTNQMNQGQQQANASQNMMMYVMQPLMSLWIGFTLPAGLCIYWISNSVLGMVQETIMGKMLKKDYEEAQRVMAEQAAKAKEAEKERRRLAAEKKASALAEKKSGKKKSSTPKAEEPAGPVIDKSASRVGMRQYARGRAYDPDRYPVTPYRDRNEVKKEEEPAGLTEEEKQLLAQDAAGQALLEQAEAAAQAEPGVVPETSVAPENAAPAESASDAPIYDKPDYDRPDYDHETKE